MIPRAMLPHRMGVRDYLGSDATGPLHGPERVIRCYIEQRTRTVHTPDGRLVVGASTVIRASPDSALIAESLVQPHQTGPWREVAAVTSYDFPRTASHIEITLQ